MGSVCLHTAQLYLLYHPVPRFMLCVLSNNLRSHALVVPSFQPRFRFLPITFGPVNRALGLSCTWQTSFNILVSLSNLRKRKNRKLYLQLGLEHSLHALLDSVEVCSSGDIVVLALLSTCKSKILGHDTLLVDDVDTGLLERLGEFDNLGSVVELTTLGKTTGPGEDGSNGVGRCGVTLLVLAEVTSDGTVSGLRLECLAIGGDEDRGHQTKTAETLGDDVGLDITVVVCMLLVLYLTEITSRNHSLFKAMM
jgi:hypothetical protein